MWRKKIKEFFSYIIKHSMVVFPLLVVAAAAATVAIALGAGGSDDSEIDDILAIDGIAVKAEDLPEETLETAASGSVDESLVENEDEGITSLITAYYNALAQGDVETIKGLSNFVKDTEIVRIQELGKYTDSYPTIQIYTKPGPVEGSWIAYVYTLVTFYGYEDQVPGFKGFYICTDENGSLYMNDGETDEEILAYIKRVSEQEDVVDLNNRVNAEYNELMTSREELFDYISELEREVSIAAGEALASQTAEESSASENGADEEAGGQEGSGQELTGTATTAVNVRVSDSELADKLGKLAAGDQVKVQEVRQNGWTKIVYEGKDGYVKSEYLLVTGNGEDPAADGAAENPQNSAASSEENGNQSGQGTVAKTATANLNLRREANTSSDKLGTVVGGDTVEVLSESGEWSQIRYKGLVGYVKSEYLR